MTHRLVRSVGRRVPRLAVVLALAVSSGCWLQIGASGGHTRYNAAEDGLTPANVPGLRPVWSVDVPGQLSEPMVSQGRVFVTRTTDTSVGVRAVALSTGATIWDRTLISGAPGVGAFVAGTPVTAVGGRLETGHLGFAPVSPGGPVCILATDVLDPATGAIAGGGAGFPSPTASESGIVARSVLRGGPTCSSPISVVLEVSSAQAGSPTEQWTAPLSGTGQGDFTPAVAGFEVFVRSSPSVLQAYNGLGCGASSCTPVWSHTATGAVGAYGVAPTGPVFVVEGSDLVVLDRHTGARAWSVPLGGFGHGLAVAGGTVFVTTSGGAGPALVAVDAAGCGAATCSPRWTAPLSGDGPTAPVVGGRVVYTSTLDGVQAFDTAGCGAPSCPALATVALESNGTLSVAQGHVLVAGDGTLTALSVRPSGS